MNTTTSFEVGTIYVNGNELNTTSNIQWEKHPKFPGVSIKNILTGKDCNNHFSAMIVKIEPHHEIGSHVHDGKSELHEIITGAGTATVGDTIISYKPGTVSFIPSNTSHSIKAGDTGILLLAKFTPPL